MEKITKTYFNLVEMINVTIDNYILLEPKLSNDRHLNMKRIMLLFFMVLSTSSLFAQVPSLSYSGVQNNYIINNAISPLSPTNIGGVPSIRANVGTVAGNGVSGYADGTIASPKYYSPTGVAIAASGNIYVADSQNHCIRKITTTGFVSTFAGTGVAGFANGDGTVAQFNLPYSIAVDASENLYVTESNSNAVRKITSAGLVSTFAGNITTSGFYDAQGTSALFFNPKGVGIDTTGNVYVADSGNNRIRKISNTGLVTTIAGDGTAGYLNAQGTSAKFNNPIGVAVNSSTVYISDTANNCIRAISNTGLVTTVAGNTSPGLVNGQGTASQFNAPRALAADTSGNLYVVDYNNNCIRKISNTGLVSTLSGTGAFGAVNGVGSVATFKYPEGITLDSSGNAFVADVTNNCIRKITSVGDTSTYSGSAVRGLENGQGGTMAMFNSPVAVAVSSAGIIYVIDDFNSCIRKVSTNGIVSTLAGNTTTGNVDGQGGTAYFNNPKGIALDSAGNIYVADTFNNCIRKVTSAGVVTTIAGDGTVGYLDGQGTAAKFNNPYSLTVDASGNIYVADTKNSRIRKISTTGMVTTVAGYILSGYVDGASTVARFKNPQGIAIDNATGILYVADTTNNRIRKIATDGTVSTFAGSLAGYTEGQGTLANFYNPIGITLDALGNIYVGDYYNSVIRKITSTGLVSTYAGNGSSNYLDGIGNIASFYFPVGVTADLLGNVFVADSYTQRIRKITSTDPYTITPNLPLGINFNTTNGVLSGIPTELKATTLYTISASNYSGTGTTTMSFATVASGTTPPAPTATSQTFCNSTTVANLVASGTSLQWYNAATGGTALASTTALTTGNYYVSQTVNSIESARTTVAVTVNITAAPTATSQTFCGSATVSNLVAIGTSLKWYTVTTGGTALASTTALSTGNYYVSQTLNSCESARTTISVIINNTLSPTSTSQTFCGSSTVANLVATGTALQWYNTATGGTALASTTALSTGIYYVSQTLNSCESARTNISVIINNTLSPTASSQTFCNSVTVANLVATGTALQWYNTATGGTALASTTSLTTGNYYVSQTLNSCESSRTTVNVILNTTAVPTATAQTFNNSATVANLVATGTSLQWYTVATGGTALASTTLLSTGNYYVSQTLNSCESTRTLVAVTINSAPGAPTATSQTFCNSATVANLLATGTSLQWYNAATGGTALASTTALTTGNYYVSQTVNSIESARTTVSVTVNITTAPTSTSQTFCGSATVANLVATGTSLKWYTVTTGGTPLASTFSLVSGNFYVTQTLNSCESSRTLVIVTINNTNAPTATSQTFCNGVTVANLLATGTALQWYSVATGGSALASTTALTTGNYYVSQTINSCESTRATVSVTINIIAPPVASATQSFNNSAIVANLVATGTTLKWYSNPTTGTPLTLTTALVSGNYYVSQTLNSCESARTLVTVIIDSTPAAPIANSQTFCNSATVANLGATGTSLKWYDVATGGSALASTTPLITSNYYVSQTVNSVESPRTIVAVTINTTFAPSASAQTFCNGATVANLVASGTSLQWYNVSSGGVALALNTALATGNYYVSQTLNSCESSRTLVIVTVNTTVAPIVSEQTFCNSATLANLVATGTTLQWYTVATGGTPLTANTTLASGNYYVTQTLNLCESTRTIVAVTVNTTASPTASSQTFCGSATVANLVATGTSLQWYTFVTGGTALASNTALASGNYYVSQTLNSCESARTIVSVSLSAIAAPSALTQTFCNGATVANLIATGTSLQWYNVPTGGIALALTTPLTSGNYYVSQIINSCESARTIVAIAVNTTVDPLASAQTFCNSATVTNLVATGTSLRWYNVATGGTVLASNTTLSSGNYYASQTLNSCESTRTLVVVTVNVTPAPTATSQSFNAGATVANLVATGTSLKWYNIATGGTALMSTTSISSGNYYVSQTLNSCESSRTLVAVTVSNIVSAPIALAQTFCISAIVADLVATGISLKWYSIATGGTALASTTALVTANYYVSQTINSIEGPRTLVTVTIYAAPIAKSINSPTSSGSVRYPICTSATKVLNVRQGYSSSKILWETAVIPLNSNLVPASTDYTLINGANGPSYTVTTAIVGKNYFRAKFINGDCDATAVYSSPIIVYYNECAVNKLISVFSYPNPYSENFNLNLTTTSEAKVTVSIYDMTGKLIEEQELNLSDVAEFKTGQRYPSGIYNIVVNQGGEVQTTRVIKK